MAFDVDAAEIAELTSRLTPYGRRLLAAAGDEALRIHADEVSPEHLLLVLMAAEESAAHRAVLAAFADPETIAAEGLALAEGMLVVGSSCALPFSPLGVSALRAASALSEEEGAAALDTDQLVAASARALGAELFDALVEDGLAVAAPRAREDPSADEPATDPLSRGATDDALRVLSQAARLADREEAPSIGPAHLLLAALEGGDHAGLSARRAWRVLQGKTRDASPLPDRPLEASDRLVAFLASLPGGAGSLAMLIGFHAEGTEDLAGLLQRHRVTRPFLERAAELRDPD